MTPLFKAKHAMCMVALDGDTTLNFYDDRWAPVSVTLCGQRALAIGEAFIEAASHLFDNRLAWGEKKGMFFTSDGTALFLEPMRNMDSQFAYIEAQMAYGKIKVKLRLEPLDMLRVGRKLIAHAEKLIAAEFKEAAQC
jgi:hypothetical protein